MSEAFNFNAAARRALREAARAGVIVTQFTINRAAQQVLLREIEAMGQNCEGLGDLHRYLGVPVLLDRHDHRPAPRFDAVTSGNWPLVLPPTLYDDANAAGVLPPNAIRNEPLRTVPLDRPRTRS